MRIEKGSRRLAFIGENYTAKVPRPRIKAFWERVKNAHTEGSLKELFQEGDRLSSPKDLLLSGLLENLRELKASRKVSSIINPVRISIFGLLNISETCASAELYEFYPPVKIFELEELPPRLLAHYAGHTIGNSKNFGRNAKGEIVFIDYGEKGLDQILYAYEEDIKQMLAATLAAKEEAL